MKQILRIEIDTAEYTNKCYKCIYRREVPLVDDAHSSCANKHAHVTGALYGRRSGWFFWPISFDPVWLESCDGFEAKDAPKPTND